MSRESLRFDGFQVPDLDDLSLYITPLDRVKHPDDPVYHTDPDCRHFSHGERVTDPIRLKSVFRNRRRCEICDPSGVLFFSRGGSRVHNDRNCRGLASVKSFRPVWGKAAENAETCYDACGYCDGYEPHSNGGSAYFEGSETRDDIDFSAVTLDD